MPATFSSQDALLKEGYEGPIRSAITEQVLLWNQLKKTTRKFDGRRVVFPVNLVRNEGLGASSDSTLPTSQNQNHQESRIVARRVFGRIRVEGFLIDSTKGDRGAFGQAVADETKRMVRDMSADLNRQLYGDGTGQLGEVASQSGATITMRTTGGSGFAGNDGAHYIRQGMFLAMQQGATTTNRNISLTVSAVNYSTNVVTFTITPAVAPVAGDYLYRSITTGTAAGTDGIKAQNVEMMGLSGIIDDGTLVGTLQNISRTTYPQWQAQRLFNSGTNRDITADLLQQAWDAVSISSGMTPDMIIAHHGVRRAYLATLTVDRRFTVDGRLDAGFKEKQDKLASRLQTNLEFNGVPFFVDDMCPYRRVFLINSESLRIYEKTPVSWFDKDGRILRNVAGTDDVEAHLRVFANLGTETNNCNAVIGDLNQTIPTVTRT